MKSQVLGRNSEDCFAGIHVQLFPTNCPETQTRDVPFVLPHWSFLTLSLSDRIDTIRDVSRNLSTTRFQWPGILLSSLTLDRIKSRITWPISLSIH